MTKTPKRPRDPNQLAKMIAGIATGDELEDEISFTLLISNIKSIFHCRQQFFRIYNRK